MGRRESREGEETDRGGIEAGREKAGVEKERKKESWRHGHISKGTTNRHASCGPGVNKYPLGRDVFRVK